MNINQRNFSTLLFDTLFGLILFFSIDSFLNIKDPFHFTFYLFSTIVLIHWWLIFKSADDAFGQEVSDSSIDLVAGIIYMILLEYVILLAKDGNYTGALGYLIALFSIDFIWALLWRFIGKWKTKDTKKIRSMEKELNYTLILNIFMIFITSILLFLSSIISAPLLVILFILSYIIYIVFTYKTQIIDMKIF